MIAETLYHVYLLFLPSEQSREGREDLFEASFLNFAPPKKAEPAVAKMLWQLCGKSGAAYRQRWLEDYVLSDSVLGHAVPGFVREFTPEYPQVRFCARIFPRDEFTPSPHTRRSRRPLSCPPL